MAVDPPDLLVADKIFLQQVLNYNLTNSTLRLLALPSGVELS